MKYVTYYDSLLGGIQDVVFHSDKESAAKYYRKYAHCYFEGLVLPKTTRVPTACGYPHRMVGVMSERRFKKEYPEYVTTKSSQVEGGSK